MRISTSMIFNSGVNTINSKTANLLHTQQQVSLGRRMVTAADDPVAAARALEVQQSANVNTQQATNLDNAKSALGLEESQLSSVNDLVANIRTLVVKAGNATLSMSDRRSIATELRSDYDQLMTVANAADGSGKYLFSGYMGDTTPFGGTIDNINQAAGNEIGYYGDSGQRSLQVAATRNLPISDAGDDIFKRIRNGNGYFTTGFNPTNSGGGVIGAGSVLNPATYNNSTVKNVNVLFTVDTTVIPNKTYYDLVDATAGSATSGTSLLTGQTYTMPLTSSSAPAAATSGQLRAFTDGQPISLKSVAGDTTAFDLGSTLVITGAPAQGDSFSTAPSTSQSIFKTIATVVNVLETAVTATTSGSAALANNLGFALTNLDQANDNILRVRAAVGSRLAEIDSLSSTNQDVNLQYQSTLSNLQDLDYAKTITDLTRQQTDLQAAQKSFVNVSQLSLFNYIQ
ncbi:MAG TPA: flagellar hook-associated protein FlgL [Rhodocyclaceae bacterium]|nr:flagellar hook-associated protein FlgL [Rhodocyclaceae bacterium]